VSQNEKISKTGSLSGFGRSYVRVTGNNLPLLYCSHIGLKAKVEVVPCTLRGHMGGVEL